MKNAFDRLIEGLINDYGVAPFNEKNHDDEVYCFTFENNIAIKVYQDNTRWVYFQAELGSCPDLKKETLLELLSLNQFSFRKPFLTLGIDDENIGVLHTRVPLVEVDNIEMRRIFENTISTASGIKKQFNFYHKE
ncbi:CesT family type III secretion system chaperone [Erwinia psidii]|uniref:Type III chaperone protein ShcF n=1 Tax=Erwinia psidii TaxID=69224 RepID=A0A3N6SCY6_9GAMM|nr:CesT family type III secretion system chaperone [Erwinia psidii]MCX8959503.1 type III chaperone protein ShcF [Erwinia psidii]MCX8961895.1 type III chaperone protein ShcF [Erwinia psidii]RQM37753.1 type III chaperone protein ShcF [Erwinia psidii]